MISSTVLKYAKALVDVAVEAQQEDQVHRDMVTFSELLVSHDELMESLSHPAIPFSAKTNIVYELAKVIPLSQFVTNFVLLLMECARIHQFWEAVEAFQVSLDEHRGIVRGRVSSCVKVNVNERQRLDRASSALTNKQVRLEYELDDSLIGGLELQIGSTIYDGSVRTQLEEIRRRLGK